METSGSYTSEQLHHEQERHTSSTSTTTRNTTTTTAGGTTQSENVAVTSPPPHVAQQLERPLPVPIQPVLSAPPTITPSANTPTMINNPNTTHITHHTTSSIININSSTSSSSVVQQFVAVPSPLPSRVEQSQSSLSATLVQDVAAAAAGAAAAQVASVLAEREASWREKDRETQETQERIHKELLQLRIREEKAAFEQKEKSDKDEKELRALRVAIELKEKEEAELRMKQEREERAARALKQKLEWEAVEGAKDQVARLARVKQDEERGLQLRSDEERKYREWSRAQTLQREQRQRESDELFGIARKVEEGKTRKVETQDMVEAPRNTEDRSARDRSIETRNSETRNIEDRDTEIRSTGTRNAEIRSIEDRNTETRSIGAHNAETHNAETHNTEIRSSEDRDTEARRIEDRNIEIRSSEDRSTETRGIEACNTETRNTETRSAEARNIETRSAEARRIETRSTEIHSAEARNTEIRSSEDRNTEIRSIEARRIETRSAETRSAEARNIETEVESVRRLEQKQVQTQQKHLEEGLRQDSIGVRPLGFLKEQEQSSRQAKVLEQDRIQFEIRSFERQVEVIEVEKVEIIQERRKTAEKLSKLKQVAVEAYADKDESKIQEVQRQIQAEEDKENRLSIEQEKKAVVQEELRKQEEVRIQELERQIKVQEIVAAKTKSNTRRLGELAQGLGARTRANKEEVGLEIEEQNRVVFQMGQGMQEEERTRGFVTQVDTEKGRETGIRVEREKPAQTKLGEWQDGFGKTTGWIAAEEHQITPSRIEAEQEMAVAEAQPSEEVRVQIEDETQDEWQHISEEDRIIIDAEVRRRRSLERGNERRTELEEKAAELQRRIAEAAKSATTERETRRARRRARSDDPEYKEREARRSRERSKVRETEKEKARREEIAFVRKNAGLDKKKKRYNSADPLPNQDIPGFVERSWTVPFGVPTLIQTPPSPPPGTLQYPRILHCEGSYFTEVAGQMGQDLVMSPDIFVVRPIASSAGIEGSVGFSQSVETSSEFEHRMRGSSQSLKDVETAVRLVTETPLIATGSPFPVPTVASGFGVGASVIGYQQKDSNQFDQFGVQQGKEPQQYDKVEYRQGAEAQRYGESQELVSYGPELPPDFRIIGTDRTTKVYPSLDSPENSGSQPSGTIYQALTGSDSQSKSNSEHTLSSHSRQQKASEAVLGPTLSPAQITHQSTYGAETTASSEKRTSSSHSHQQEISEVVYGPELPPIQTPHQNTYSAETTVSSDHRSESSFERATSTYSSNQKSSTVAWSAVEASHRSISSEGAQSFRIPGTSDEQIGVIEESSRESRTSSGV